MTIESHGHEHELEPQYGLPERLPAGEKLLWQGSPDFAGVALRIFHLRKAVIYFAALLLLRAGLAVNDSGLWLEGLVALAWPLPLALTALACLLALAWMTAKTAVYTLTDKRLVLRIGIVLTLTFNIPLRSIKAAALRQAGGPNGDIVVQLTGPDHIAFLHLWPHVRPWHVARPEPMLRAVVDAPKVAALLTQAWGAANAQHTPTQAQATEPATSPTVLAPIARTALPTDTAKGQAPSPWQPSPT
jgi:Bacterial PH domain